MKCIYLFLIVLILFSCLAPKKEIEVLPLNNAEDSSIIFPKTNTEKKLVEDYNTAQYYSLSYRNGSDVIYYGANDLNFLISDTSIKSLSLSGGTFQDLRPLAKLSLKSLHLSGGTFYDLGPLAELTELEELSIQANLHITDISPIGSLVNLKKLILADFKGNIEAVSSLVNLEYLSLSYNDVYYKELVPLQRLEVLDISNPNGGRWDISYIAQLYSLKDLRISGGNLVNIERLKNLVNLENLYLGNIIVSSGINISWITHLKMLRSFELRTDYINDIKPLLELPNLVAVDLYQTVVRDISPLLESKTIKIITGFVTEKEYDGSLFWERGIQITPYFSDR
jgi:hypothetical protein